MRRSVHALSFIIAFVVMMAGASLAQDGFRGLATLGKRPTVALATPAEAIDTRHAPTPHSQVAIGLDLLEMTPNDMIADFGSGDGRVLVAAVEQHSAKKAIGVEIDADRAAEARRRVDHWGLSDRVEVITGNAITTDVVADVAYVYLYPEVLTPMADKLRRYRRVVSYRHQVPGLPMTQHGDFWLYKRTDRAVAATAAPVKVKQQVVMQTQTQYQWQRVRVPPWNTGQPCGDRSCPMCYGSWQWKQVPVQAQVAVSGAQRTATTQPCATGCVSGCAGGCATRTYCTQSANGASSGFDNDSDDDD